ncbi:MAG: SixA phosphatase family protein [Nevskiaceae bacterium]
MKILTLVRHAKSSRDYPELSDFERPLNPRGRKEAPVIAARLRKADVKPDLLVSSPATRAIATARLFAEELNMHLDEILLNPHIYEASAWTLLHIVRSLSPDYDDVMVFGHNPGISNFARDLAGDCPFDEMPTCAAVRIELPARGWSLIQPGSGKVLRYDAPTKAER